MDKGGVDLEGESGEGWAGGVQAQQLGNEGLKPLPAGKHRHLLRPGMRQQPHRLLLPHHLQPVQVGPHLRRGRRDAALATLPAAQAF